MNLFQTAVLGMIEGLTEYLPISSTFHLIWTSKFLGVPQTEFQKLFEVVIQSGAILAVIVLYLKELSENKDLNKKILFAFIPTALVGFVLYKIIKGVFFENLLLQVVVFIFVGIAFVVFEKSGKTLTKPLGSLTLKEAVMVGFAQSLAVIPGVSRAGAVILALMLLGVKRAEAAKFSFLLALPTLIAASIYDLYKSRGLLFGAINNIEVLAIGTLFSFISALLIIKWFIGYLQKNTLVGFGWYRIVVGIILLIFLTNLQIL